MKAVIVTQYGSPDVLRVQEMAAPTPKDNEVLVRVRATPINFGDTLARNFRAISPGDFSMPAPLWLLTKFYFGFSKPNVRVLGSEFAGDVAAVGSAVTRFTVGEPVFGYLGQQMGANAEYICIAEDGLLAARPDRMTYEEAASVPYGALTALSLLRGVGIQPGQKVLINGASGGIGSYAVQLARHFGAEVTGVCSTPRVAYVQALGAAKVIDYTKEDFTRSGDTYDLIVDIRGKLMFGHARPALTPDGRLLYVSFKTGQLLQMLWTARFSRQKVICALSSETQADLLFIRDLIDAGEITAVIDRAYPLEQAAEAHRYVEKGGNAGHVVLRMA